jgi:hypothetical protein
MTVVQILRPSVIEIKKLPQCSVPVKGDTSVRTARREQRRRDKGWDQDFCQASASYNINGAAYCTHHAGIAALRILVNGK